MYIFAHKMKFALLKGQIYEEFSFISRIGNMMYLN
jgi:hypothetical protein